MPKKKFFQRTLVKLAITFLVEMLLEYAETKGKTYADELRSFIEEFREHERI